jgi:hypothetical protein
MVYGTLYAGVDYNNLTLGQLQRRLQHLYHWQPYARVGFIPQSGTKDLASGPYDGGVRFRQQRSKNTYLHI